MSVISDLEDVIESNIETQLTYLHTSRTFGGNVAEFMMNYVGDLPMVLIEYAGDRRTPESGSSTTESIWKTYLFQIHLATISGLDESTARRKSQGAYDIIEGIQTAIDGSRLTKKNCQDLHIMSVVPFPLLGKPGIKAYEMQIEWEHLEGI